MAASAGLGASDQQPRRKIGQQTCIPGEPEVGTGQPRAQQPVVEFRRPLQAEEVADIEGVVE
jgi:hypothetical protein